MHDMPAVCPAKRGRHPGERKRVARAGRALRSLRARRRTSVASELETERRVVEDYAERPEQDPDDELDPGADRGASRFRHGWQLALACGRRADGDADEDVSQDQDADLAEEDAEKSHGASPAFRQSGLAPWVI